MDNNIEMILSAFVGRRNNEDRKKQLQYYHDQTSPKSILNVALEVHMVHTGAMDYYQDYFKDVSLLKHAINIWMSDRGCAFKRFDDKVKDLIIQVISDNIDYVDKYGLYAEYSVSCEPYYFMTKAKKCTCHERDSSQTCPSCHDEGFFGHNEADLAEEWKKQNPDKEVFIM